MKKALLIAMIALTIAACTHKTATVVSEVATKTSNANVTQAQFEEGKKVYEQYCGKCHALKSPGDFTADRWVKLIDRMAGRARIDEAQKQQIYNYVSVNAAN